MARYIPENRFAAKAQVSISTSFRADQATKDADKAAALYFRSWETNVRIERSPHGASYADVTMKRTFGWKEGIIEARVFVTGNNLQSVMWCVKSYRDETMDRQWSKGLNDPIGWCNDLAEAHTAVSERIAMLMNMAVPTPAAVREMKERIAREDKEAQQEITARTVAVVAKLKASHEASSLIAGETA